MAPSTARLSIARAHRQPSGILHTAMRWVIIRRENVIVGTRLLPAGNQKPAGAESASWLLRFCGRSWRLSLVPALTILLRGESGNPERAGSPGQGDE